MSFGITFDEKTLVEIKNALILNKGIVSTLETQIKHHANQISNNVNDIKIIKTHINSITNNTQKLATLREKMPLNIKTECLIDNKKCKCVVTCLNLQTKTVDIYVASCRITISNYPLTMNNREQTSQQGGALEVHESTEQSVSHVQPKHGKINKSSLKLFKQTYADPDMYICE